MTSVMQRGVVVRAALVLALAAAAGGATAQTVNSLRSHDSSAPVDFAADRIELQDRADRAVLTGNVEVNQGDMKLRAARVTIAYTGGNQTQVNRMDASGNVVLTTSTETARSAFAIYDLRTRLVTMIGNVVVSRAGKGETRGNRLVLNLNSGQASLGGGGRVTGRFTPPPRAATGGPRN